MTRREVLIEMLRRYEDAQETLIQSGEGSSGWGFKMPATWNRSYRELYRCLCVLRESDKQAYVHLHARYVSPWRVRAEVRVRNGRPLLPARTELAARQVVLFGSRSTVTLSEWAEWVDPRLVGRGLDFLEREFRGEPYLPAALFDVSKATA